MVRAYLRVGRISKLDKICRIYLRELLDVVRCDECAIVLANGDKAEILAQKVFSQIFPSAEFNSAIPAIRDMVVTKGAISTADIAGSSVARYIPSTIRSLICTPIILDGDVKGIVCAFSLSENVFNAEDMDFIKFISEHVSRFFAQPPQLSEAHDVRKGDRLEGCFTSQEFYTDLMGEIDSVKRYQDDTSLLRVKIEAVEMYDEVTGRAAGDSLLESILHILDSNMRAYHKIYRYGQSEFAIVLGETSKEKALIVAGRLRDVLEQGQFERDGSQLNGKVKISIGVAAYPADADQIDSLIEAANPALQLRSRA